MQVIYHVFLPTITGDFYGFSADGDGVMDGLPDGLTDKSVDIQMERSFPGYCIKGNFHTGIRVSIFTVNLADRRMDGTDNGHTG